jgi:hypothetical protein
MRMIAMKTAAGSFLFATLVAVALPVAGGLPAAALEELRAADTTVVEKGYRAANLRGSEVRNDRKDRRDRRCARLPRPAARRHSADRRPPRRPIPSDRCAVQNFRSWRNRQRHHSAGATRKALEHFPEFMFDG